MDTGDLDGGVIGQEGWLAVPPGNVSSSSLTVWQLEGLLVSTEPG